MPNIYFTDCILENSLVEKFTLIQCFIFKIVIPLSTLEKNNDCHYFVWVDALHCSQFFRYFGTFHWLKSTKQRTGCLIQGDNTIPPLRPKPVTLCIKSSIVSICFTRCFLQLLVEYHSLLQAFPNSSTDV